MTPGVRTTDNASAYCLPVVLSWVPCRAGKGCIGVAVDGHGRCVRHTVETERKRLIRDAPSSRVFFLLQGVEVDGDLLAAVLAAFPTNDDDQVLFRHARFQKTQFLDAVIFERAIFNGWTSFSEASFAKHASFASVQFEREVLFTETVFKGESYFMDARFGGRASFLGTTFGGRANFDRARWAADAEFAPVHSGGKRVELRFIGEASFNDVEFCEQALFTESKFESTAAFTSATFGQEANFIAARFARYANFWQSTFSMDAAFQDVSVKDQLVLGCTRFDADWFSGGVNAGAIDLRGALLPNTRNIGPVVADAKVDLSAAQFGSYVTITAETPHLSCAHAVFRGGGIVRANAESVDVAGAQFHRPTIVTGIQALEEETVDDQGADSLNGAPSIMSLRAADVSGLVLSGVDLTNCRFVGAHNVDQLRIEGDPKLLKAPRLHAQRRTLFDEHLWRSHQGSRAWTRPGISEDANDCPSPTDIAEAYRSLRKGRELRGDAPGAADFYYGEMEMRRRASTSWAERQVLRAYWLVAGYGLRASRALVGFVVLITVATVLLMSHGLRGNPTWSTAALSSLGAATGIPVREGTFTEVGIALRIALRVVAPVFLAMTVLAVRSRVHRQ